MNGLFGQRRQLPVLRQTENSECALVCLAMVLNYHGHRIDLTTLRLRCAAPATGMTLNTLVQLADRMHLAARPLQLELDELSALQLPAILHWDLKHFVVLKAVRAGRLHLHDPALGTTTMSLADANVHFTGVALELMPTAAFERRDERITLRLRDLWHYSEGLASSLGQLLLLSLLLQAFTLALPFYTQLFVDDVLVNQDHALLKIMATGFLLVAILRSTTELLRAKAVLYLGNTIGFQFATNVCRHLLRLPLVWFARRHPGDVLSRFGSLNQIKDFLCSGIVEVVIDGIMVIGTLVLMLVYSRLLTAVALVSVVIYVALRSAMQRNYRRHNEEVLQTTASENSHLLESLRAIQGIRLHGKEPERLSLWQNLHADVINAGVRLQNLVIWLRLANGLLLGIENIVLMLLGGLAVLNNDISIGMLLAYLGFKDQFYGRVFALVDKLFELKLLELHLERLADIALQPQERYLQGAGAPIACSHEGLQLSSVGFRHHDDMPWLFRHVELTVGDDEVVAIIGPTGCGKSTLLKLATSLLQPAEGGVTLYGVPINSMGLPAFREHIAAVLQDDALLSGSIFDNITFFDATPDRERVEMVANLAAIAHEIQHMPMQYNTLVGSMGAALSGGQIQRLLLARALYKRPRLLVLDEATSHLDVDTEQAVNKAIRQLKIARLIVAHRPQTILQADRILELTPNGLREVSHADLCARQQNSHWPQRRLAV